jgi:hypothetical protein
MRSTNTQIATSQYTTNKIPNVLPYTFVFVQFSPLKMIPYWSKLLGITLYNMTQNLTNYCWFWTKQGTSITKVYSGTCNTVSSLNKVVSWFMSWDFFVNRLQFETQLRNSYSRAWGSNPRPGKLYYTAPRTWFLHFVHTAKITQSFLAVSCIKCGPRNRSTITDVILSHMTVELAYRKGRQRENTNCIRS